MQFAYISWQLQNLCYVLFCNCKHTKKKLLTFCLAALTTFINLPSLANRRTMLGTVFICKLIRGDVESADLISRLNFCVPGRFTRNYISLILNHSRCNYEMQDPYRVLCSDYNILYPIIGILSLCSF